MKKTYKPPQSSAAQLECEGMLAASTDYIPNAPHKPGTAATNKHERIWGKTLWADNH